jgi:serine/threonine protein kinase
VCAVLQLAKARLQGQPIVFTTAFDMWQLGTFVYEVSVGKKYWPASQTDLQILHALASPSVQLPHEARPVETELVQRILSQLLTRNPAHRLTADSLKKLLDKEEETGTLAATINAGFAKTETPIVLDP